MLRCARCGKLFCEEDIKYVQESRGEFWGMPAYETMAYSPCCMDDIEDTDWDEDDEEYTGERYYEREDPAVDAYVEERMLARYEAGF